MKNSTIDQNYFREYRSLLGFSNRLNFGNYLSAKDIVPAINFDYIDSLNLRLCEIIKKLSELIPQEIRVDNIDNFIDKNIFESYEILQKNNILPRLNNQGRRPEQVYFSWMRGFVISKFFSPAISLIFNVPENDIQTIGDDDLKNPNIFKRSPKADIEIKYAKDKSLVVEVQSGFQGINDIKQHKVIEAKRTYQAENKHTLAIHFDLYNGQVAFIVLDQIKDNDINWITRQQMEGQTVFTIDANLFAWKLTKLPPKREFIQKLIGF